MVCLTARLWADGFDVNAAQVRRGMAWEYSFHHSDGAMIALQSATRQTAEVVGRSFTDVAVGMAQTAHRSSPAFARGV